MVFRRHLFFLCMAIMFCIGFRSFPSGNNWPLDKSTTAGSKIFVVYPYGTRAIENDLPSGDPLYGTSTVTINNLMTSIFNDYNNIGASFLILANSSDADYAAQSRNRIITIEESTPNGAVSGGDAQQTRTNGQVTACLIRLKSQVFDKAKSMVQATTHEIGHCLGLDHPQEITQSVMSYFQPGNLVRLQADDMMGITYLYPTDSSKAKEVATLGLSCAQRQ